MRYTAKGVGPSRRSSKRVPLLTALVNDKSAHGNNDKHNRSSCCRALHNVARSIPKSCVAIKLRARRIKTARGRNHMRQSRQFRVRCVANVRFPTAPTQSHAIQFESPPAASSAKVPKRSPINVICPTPIGCGIVQCTQASARERLRHTHHNASKLVNATTSMTCARSVRPAFTAVPIGKSRKLRKTVIPSSNTKQIHPNPLLQKAYQLRLRRFNRTHVIEGANSCPEIATGYQSVSLPFAKMISMATVATREKWCAMAAASPIHRGSSVVGWAGKRHHRLANQRRMRHSIGSRSEAGVF